MITFDEEKHAYYWQGQPIPSVTQILKAAYPRPELIRWAAWEVARYVHDNVNELAAEVNNGRDITKRLSMIPTSIRDKAGARGTFFHEIAANLTTGTPVRASGEMAEMAARFVRFIEEHQIKPLACEFKVLDLVNYYAGTADLLAEKGGQTWLFDIKTSRSLHPDYGLQLAAYAKALSAFIDGKWQEMPKIARIGVIHVQPDQIHIYEYKRISDIAVRFRQVRRHAKTIELVNKTSPVKIASTY